LYFEVFYMDSHTVTKKVVGVFVRFRAPLSRHTRWRRPLVKVGPLSRESDDASLQARVNTGLR
jgi:hypothetical protein